MDIRSAARALGGEISGNSIGFPTPGHSTKDRGSRVTFKPDAPEGFVVHCHNGYDDLQLRDYVRLKLGLSQPTAPRERFQPIALREASQEGWTPAGRLWQGAISPIGTLVETYLLSRGIQISDAVLAVDVIRFHPECRFGGEVHPAMVCLMQSAADGKPTGIHRTALRPDGSGKAEMADGGSPKRMLGKAAGSAIKLGSAITCRRLAIAEGVEDALTIENLGLVPVWALGNSGAIQAFVPLPEIDELTIYGDADPAGAAAARYCAEKWSGSGVRARVLLPREFKDWNEWRMANA
jgi:hypothetical protein